MANDCSSPSSKSSSTSADDEPAPLTPVVAAVPVSINSTAGGLDAAASAGTHNTLCKDWTISVSAEEALEHARSLGTTQESLSDMQQSGFKGFPWVAVFQSVRMGLKAL